MIENLKCSYFFLFNNPTNALLYNRKCCVFDILCNYPPKNRDHYVLSKYSWLHCHVFTLKPVDAYLLRSAILFHAELACQLKCAGTVDFLRIRVRAQVLWEFVLINFLLSVVFCRSLFLLLLLIIVLLRFTTSDDHFSILRLFLMMWFWNIFFLIWGFYTTYIVKSCHVNVRDHSVSVFFVVSDFVFLFTFMFVLLAVFSMSWPSFCLTYDYCFSIISFDDLVYYLILNWPLRPSTLFHRNNIIHMTISVSWIWNRQTIQITYSQSRAGPRGAKWTIILWGTELLIDEVHNSSWGPEFTLDFGEVRVVLSFVFCIVFCRSSFVLLSIYVWPLCYLSFVNLRYYSFGIFKLFIYICYAQCERLEGSF